MYYTFIFLLCENPSEVPLFAMGGLWSTKSFKEPHWWVFAITDLQYMSSLSALGVDFQLAEVGGAWRYTYRKFM